ncbi:monovalent cation/H+ antiporter complex subunit F, partial [Streptococcus pneumoniae]|nr:monovalent cation/H+ antiporter complex subunit F [Streptococcus pneumoniae]
MIAAALLAVLVAMALVVVRALRGPSTFDRLLAANSIGNGAILVLALFGFLTGRPEFLDLGLTYALLNYVGIFAVLKFFRHGS